MGGHGAYKVQQDYTKLLKVHTCLSLNCSFAKAIVHHYPHVLKPMLQHVTIDYSLLAGQHPKTSAQSR